MNDNENYNYSNSTENNIQNFQTDNNVNLYNQNNKTPNTSCKKRKIIIVVIVLILLIIIVGILVINNNETSEPQNNNSANNMDHKDTVDNEDLRKIKSGKLDLYNDISESNYLSIVLYDPLRDRQQSGDRSKYDKSIIVTYDLGENIKNDFIDNGFKTMALDSNSPSLKYYFGITNGKYIVNQAVTTTKLQDGNVCLGLVTKKDENFFYYKTEGSNSISTSKKNNQSKYYIYGSNWRKLIPNADEEVDNISLKIAETEDNEIYVGMQLKNNTRYNNTFVETVNNMVLNNDFKNTVTIIEDTDKLNSIVNVYGKELNLSESIFYQDLLSNIISNEYGLNLRNKDYFIHTDTSYVRYAAYTSDDYRTEIDFNIPYNEYDYNTAKSEILTDYFEYLYKGIKYSYFANYGTIYVYKNEKLVGTLKVTHKGQVPQNIFNEVNYLFGTKK